MDITKGGSNNRGFAVEETLKKDEMEKAKEK